MGIIKKVGGPAIPPAQLSPTNKAGAKSAAQVIDSSVVGRMQGRSIPATLSFSGLFSEKSKATFILKTKDKELVGERKSLFDDDKGYVPETLNGIPEANFIWDFINNPSSDLSQILQRQTLLTTLLNSDSLEQLMQVKNEAYKLCRGVSALFKTVDVSGYGNYEPLLTAYKRGNDQYEDEVMRALDMIESGKESLVALLPLLKSVSPALMGDIVSTLSDHLMNVDHFNRDFFLDQDVDTFEVAGLKDALFCDLERVGAFISFACLAKRDGYGVAGYDQSASFSYKDGWSFLKEKEGLVANDSPKDDPLVVLCGSNMSGKSFNLKQNMLIQLMAQSFGMVPATEGNFYIYDSIFYLDRASTSPYNDLSAYGQEIIEWNNAFSEMKKKPLLFVDEGFSTTSPEDQYKLLRAVSIYLKKRGARMFLASHNEMFIDVSQSDSDIGIYHFKTGIKENNDMDYQHKLTPGADDSKALAVARSMGLPEEIIEDAQRFLDGEYGPISRSRQIDWVEPVPFSEEERGVMKGKGGTRSFTVGRKQAFLQLFTEDPNFTTKFYSGSDIKTGEKASDWDISFGGWRDNPGKIRGDLLLSLITKSPGLSSQEILERQKMFEELAANDQYERVREITHRIIWILKFLSGIRSHANKDLLNFNNAINPFNDIDHTGMLGDLDVVFAYLEFQKKVLGEDFKMDWLYERVVRAKKLLERVDEVCLQQDVLELQRINDEVADTEVEAEVFLKLAKNEPNPEKWGGKVTRRRVAAYLSWISKNDWEYHYKVLDKLRSLIGASWDESFDAKEIRELFFSLATDEQDKDKWENRLCVQRIKDYISQLDEEKDGEKIDQLERNLLYDVKSVQRKAVIVDEKMQAEFSALLGVGRGGEGEAVLLSKRELRSFMHDLMEEVKDLHRKVPGRSIFETDTDLIREELKVILAYMKKKHKRGDYQYYHDWPGQLIFALVVEMMLDQRNYFQELIDLLRSYDGVYLHQAANRLDENRKKLFDGVKFRDVGDVFNYLKKKYDKKFRTLVDEYYQIEKECAEFVRRFRISRHSSKIKYAKFILDNINEKEDIGRMFKVVDKFRHYMGSSLGDYNDFRRDLNEFETEAERIEAVREYFQEAIIDSGALQEMQEMRDALRSVVKKISKFIKRHNISLEKDDKKYLRRGSFDIFRKAVGDLFKKKVGDALDRGYRKDRPIREDLDLVSTFALFGHMVAEQGFARVDFNSEGKFSLEDLWSMVYEKGGQVANSILFEDEERLKLFSGTNMSGKTFGLKGGTFGVSTGMSTGFAPAKAATMPMFGGAVYFDRVTSKFDPKLSSYGNEIVFWIGFCKLINSGRPVFASVDEAFSTTSPRFQSALTYAISKYAAERGHFLSFASHNHDAIEVLANTSPAFVVPYHFATHFDQAGEIQFDYRLTRGHELSHAIPVAKKLGFPQEIIDIAEAL